MREKNEVYITELETRILGIFIEYGIIYDKDIVKELQTLIKKLIES